MQINSVNPMLSANAPGEKQIAAYIAQRLQQLGIESEVEEIEENRFNVTAVLKGSGGGKSLMLNAHIDTVGVANMPNPFSANILEGKLFGRGAYDMKGSAAAMISAAKKIVENNVELKGDLVLAFVADEEYDSIGTEHLLTKVRTDGAIVTEPSNLNVCIGHRGFGLFEITTVGKVAHGGRPDIGIDANMQMGKVLAKLSELKTKLQNSKGNQLLGKPSLHVPVLRGGTEPFTYAGECKIKVEWRSIPGETLKETMKRITKIVEDLAAEDETFNAKVNNIMWRSPFETNKENLIVKTLAKSVSKITNVDADYIGHTWWEDSALIAEKGIDTVIIGPKGEGLHTANEWVDIESVEQLSEILFQTINEFCN